MNRATKVKAYELFLDKSNFKIHKITDTHVYLFLPVGHSDREDLPPDWKTRLKMVTNYSLGLGLKIKQL